MGLPDPFRIWRYRTVRDAAVFQGLRGFENIFRFDVGQALLDEFPRDAAFHMNPDHPRDRVLPDNVANSLQVLLVSARLREELERSRVGAVEYLPVTIVDHEGRVASSTHVIVHPVGLVDAIDLEASSYQPHRFVKGRIGKVRRLVIDPTRVPADRQLFKLKGYGTPVIVKRSLAESLEAGGFSGLDWLDLSAFSAG